MATFQNVQPEYMSGDDTFRMLKLISDAQKQDRESPFKFSVSVDTLNSLSEDGEIEEINQPSTSSPKPQTKHNKGKAKVASSAHPVVDFTPAFFKAKIGSVVSTDNNISISRLPSSVTPVSDAIVAESPAVDDSPMEMLTAVAVWW